VEMHFESEMLDCRGDAARFVTGWDDHRQQRQLFRLIRSPRFGVGRR